jgi:hypothetical protein
MSSAVGKVSQDPRDQTKILRVEIADADARCVRSRRSPVATVGQPDQGVARSASLSSAPGLFGPAMLAPSDSPAQ